MEKFIKLGQLGKGAFGTVYKVRRIDDGCIYALKQVQMSNLKQKGKRYRSLTRPYTQRTEAGSQ